MVDMELLGTELHVSQEFMGHMNALAMDKQARVEAMATRSAARVGHEEVAMHEECDNAATTTGVRSSASSSTRFPASWL